MIGTRRAAGASRGFGRRAVYLGLRISLRNVAQMPGRDGVWEPVVANLSLALVRLRKPPVLRATTHQAPERGG